jgi:3-dehydroquinate synthase
METIWIETASKEYPVLIGEGAIRGIKPFLEKKYPELTKLLIITDETLAHIHLPILQKELEGLLPLVFTVPSGEEAKSFEIFYAGHTFALENHLDRNSLIISFGGGAVGDVAGFIAATFMRGVPFIQVPTTILAHDSSVGGKVAINHPIGKNMIGAFYQPEAVFYDLSFLETLPDHEKRSGFAEIIKHALIADKSFYEWLITDVRSITSISSQQLADSLARGIEIKGEIVSIDEKETGIRAFLNFGHTLGHAIEAEMGYGKITHGEAVVLGMIYALNLSKEILSLDFDIEDFIVWLQGLGYETKLPLNLSEERLLQRMKQDKKTIGDSIRFVLLDMIGNPVVESISDRSLLDMLASLK